MRQNKARSAIRTEWRERSGVKANSAAATAGDAVICPIDSDGERGRGAQRRIDREERQSERKRREEGGS